MKSLRLRWRPLQRLAERQELRRRIRDELDFHVESIITENLARGLDRREARLDAESRLGHRRSIASECYTLAAEDSPASSLEIRKARRLALLSAIAVTPPALMYLLLSHHLRELPVERPAELSVSLGVVEDATSVSQRMPKRTAVFRRRSARISTPTGDLNTAGLGVSRRFFSVQGAHAALGDVSLSTGPCVILSHRLWTRHFNEDREIVSQAIQIDGSSKPVCAVMPRDYWFLDRSRLFWVFEGEAADNQRAGRLLVRSGESQEKLPPSVRLTTASRGAFSAAWAVLQAALLLLAVLGAAQTTSLAAALGSWRNAVPVLARNYLFLFAKVLPPLVVSGVLWTFVRESSTFATVGYFGAVWSLLSFYLFALLASAIVWSALVDQRGRCPVCQRALGMPLQLGVTGSILFHLPAVESICSYGHGTLYMPEPTSEGVRRPSWRRPEKWWDDLLGVGAASGGFRS